MTVFFRPQFAPFERPLRIHGGSGGLKFKPGGKPTPAPLAKRRPTPHDTRETTAVVEFTYQGNWERPLFPITGLPFPTGALDISTTPIEFRIPAAPTPALVNPFSDAMITYLYMWNRNTLNTITSDNVWFCKALLFFNLGRIKAKFPALSELKFKIAAPAGRYLNPTATTIWYVWSSAFDATLAGNISNPFTTGSPFTCPGTFCEPSGIVVLPHAFETQAEAIAWAAGFSGNPDIHVESQASVDTFPTNLSWTTRLSTYPKPPDVTRRNFPSDPVDSVDIDWNPNSESAAHTSAAGSGAAPGSPARNIFYHAAFSSLATAITAS